MDLYFRLYLGRDLGLGVRDLDAELFRAGDDVDALAGGDVVGDPVGRGVLITCIHIRGMVGREEARKKNNVLGGVAAVVHQEELNVLGVADEERLVAGGHHVPGLSVGAEADL